MNNINDLQEQIDNLIKKYQELIERLKEEQNTDVSKKVRWKPKDGELCYFITATGCIGNFYFSSKDSLNCKHYKIGNCFKTKEEAQKELDRRIAEQELLDMCDWDRDIVYCVIYNQNSERFDVNLYNTFIPAPYRFASIESAQKAIDTLGAEKLKLVFRID